MKIIKIMLLTGLSMTSLAQAAPQFCQAKDHQSGEIFRLEVEEMGLPKGAFVRVEALDEGQLEEGLYEVSGYLETGMGTYVNLTFVSGNSMRFYQMLIGIGKIFLITDKSISQLFCE